MPITIVDDSNGTWGTEYFLVGDSTTAAYNTTPTTVQVKLDLTDLDSGDTYVVKMYDKIDGSNARIVYTANFVGEQTQPWVSPAIILKNWEISLQRTAGADRTIEWSLAKVT